MGWSVTNIEQNKLPKAFVGAHVFSEAANMGRSRKWGHQGKQNSYRAVFNRFLKG